MANNNKENLAKAFRIRAQRHREHEKLKSNVSEKAKEHFLHKPYGKYGGANIE